MLLQSTADFTGTIWPFIPLTGVYYFQGGERQLLLFIILDIWRKYIKLPRTASPASQQHHQPVSVKQGEA